MHRSSHLTLLRIEAVKDRTALSRSTIYSLVATGKFPAPHRIAGSRISAWPSDLIDEWIARELGREEASHV